MFYVDMCSHILSEEKSRVGITESYTKDMFNLIRNCKIIFYGGYSIFYSHQQYMRGSSVSYPC